MEVHDADKVEVKQSQPPKPRTNPFGAARPREEVLKEKAIQTPAVEGAATAVAAHPDADAPTVAEGSTAGSKESQGKESEEPQTTHQAPAEPVVEVTMEESRAGAQPEQPVADNVDTAPE